MKGNFRNTFLVWAFALVLFFSSWVIYYKLPYEPIWNLCLLFIIFTRFKLNKISGGFTDILLFLVLIRAAIPSMEGYRDHSLTGLLSYFVKSILLFSLLYLNQTVLSQIFRCFVRAFAIIVFIGLIFHILTLLNIYRFTPITNVDVGFRDFDVYFWGSYQAGKVFRYASIFDEPGYLGTVSAFILAIGQYNLFKRTNLVIFISALFTLSLAFYFLSAIYFLFYYINIKDIRARNVLFIPLITLPFFFFFNDLFIEGVFDRLFLSEEIKESDVRGINVTYSAVDFLVNQNLLNVLFGNGIDAHLNHNLDFIRNSAWPRLIYQIGFIPLIMFIMGIFSLISAKKFRKSYSYDSRLFFLIFILSVYQRPQIFDSTMFFLLACGISRVNSIKLQSS